MNKDNINTYHELYNLNGRKEKRLNKKKVFIFVSILLLILLACAVKVYKYKEKENKIEKYISFTKTNKKIERDLKRDLRKRLRSLVKQEQLSEREIKEQKFKDTNNKEKAKEDKAENEEEQINIYKKAISINPTKYNLGKLNFIKYAYKTCKNNIKEEEVKIFPLKKINEDEYVSVDYKEFFDMNQNNLNKMYEIIENSYNAFLKDTRHKYNFDLILQNENEEEIVKNISERIKNKTFLDDAYYYLDEEGFHIYLINKTIMHKYKQDEVLKNICLDKCKIKKEDLVLDEIDFKLLILPNDVYTFLKDEYKKDYEKALEAYKLKLEKKKEEERIAKEKEIEKFRNNRKEFLKNKKYIALTFDDGPGEYTLYFLNKLKEKNVKVSFFLVGQRIPGKEYIVQRMIEDGHDVGNHSYTHPVFSRMPKEKVLEEVRKTDELIEKAVKGYHPRYLRPPYGARNKIAEKEMDKKIILWNYDPLDWKYRNVDRIKGEIMKMPENALPVMHDIHKTTVDAVLETIDAKRKEGFEFVTVTELLEKVS